MDVEKVDFVSVLTQDIPRAKKFYGETLGLPIETESDSDMEFRLGQVTLDVFDPSSIEVSRRARNAKTASIDLDKLMRTFLAHLPGEPRACSVVHVPSVEDEDGKRSNRERDRLIKERTAHTNRIKGLLHAQGIRDVQPLKRGFIAGLESMRTGDGRPLAPKLKAELVREHERLSLVDKQIKQLEAAVKAQPPQR